MMMIVVKSAVLGIGYLLAKREWDKGNVKRAAAYVIGALVIAVVL